MSENPYESPHEVSKPADTTNPRSQNAAALYVLSAAGAIGSILATLMIVGMSLLPQVILAASLAIGSVLSLWAARRMIR